MAPRRVTLTLKAVPDSPPDIPPGELVLDVPLHPAAHLIEPDRFGLDASKPFAAVTYVKRSEVVSVVVPLELGSTARWFEELFAARGYGRIRFDFSDVHDSRRQRIVFHATPPDEPEVTLQIALRSDQAGGVVASYLAEQHPVPERDPASLLTGDIERVDVEYVFMNRSPCWVRRRVTERRAIASLTDAINALPRDIRSIVGGSGVDGRAELWFVVRGSEARWVRVEPASHLVIVDSFPGLFGDIWPALQEVASPDIQARVKRLP